MIFQPCSVAHLSCFLLASTYVGSLYIWKSSYDRNHPKTVKQRFISAFCMLFISPLCVYFTLGLFDTEGCSNLLYHLGIRAGGFIPALILPLILTSILFLGPMTPSLLDRSWTITSFSYWKDNLQDILWLRNNIVAPVSEEFTFRACMLPQLLKCHSPTSATLVAPLFFGVGHLHHMYENYRKQRRILQPLLIACFQFTYTTLFGIYAAFLFVRTGHIIAPCIAHSYCNFIGFPDFGEIVHRRGYQRIILIVAYLSGLLGWCFLLMPLTTPSLYNNDIVS